MMAAPAFPIMRVARPALARVDDRPGSGMLHPVALLAVVVLVLNDHVLKAAYGSWWTGKLSDFAGLIFFPLLLQAAWELGRAALGRRADPSRRVLVGCAVATAVVFAAINLSPHAAEAYRVGLGLLQWPFRAIASWVAGGGVPAMMPVGLWMDPTDLVALPFAGVAVRIGWRRASPSAQR